MPLRLRFLSSLLAIVALMAIPALFGVNRVNRLRDIATELRGQSAQSALAVGRLQTSLEEYVRLQRFYVASADSSMAPAVMNAVQDAATAIAELRAAGYGEQVAPVAPAVARLHDAAARTQLLMERGLLDAATDYVNVAAEPLVTALRAAVPGLARAIDTQTAERVAVADASAAAAATAATTALVVALLLAGVLALATARVLTRPLERLRRAMTDVADGGFHSPARLPYDRQDEIGELARSFRTMAGRLAELDRMKAEFVGIAGHELKSPIAVIDGYIELIEEELEEVLEPRHRELIGAIRTHTGTLRHRLDQLLEISRMESGHLRLGLEEIYVAHFAESLRQAYQPLAAGRRIDYAVRVSEDTPAFIMADPDSLRSDVLDNLIGNALRFTPEGGEVRILIRGDGDRIIFEVADSGPGIPDDQLDHIFEKYWQGRGAHGGSGLGLAIARAAVEAHGGRIDAQSRLGRGSRFRVSIPTHGLA